MKRQGNTTEEKKDVLGSIVSKAKKNLKSAKNWLVLEGQSTDIEALPPNEDEGSRLKDEGGNQ